MENLLVLLFLVFFGVLIYRSIFETNKNKSRGDLKDPDKWSPNDARPVLEKSKEGYSEFQQWILLHAGTNDLSELKTYLKKKLLRMSLLLNSRRLLEQNILSG